MRIQTDPNVFRVSLRGHFYHLPFFLAVLPYSFWFFSLPGQFLVMKSFRSNGLMHQPPQTLPTPHSGLIPCVCVNRLTCGPDMKNTYENASGGAPARKRQASCKERTRIIHLNIVSFHIAKKLQRKTEKRGEDQTLNPEPITKPRCSTI